MTDVILFPRLNIQLLKELKRDLVVINERFHQLAQAEIHDPVALEETNLAFEQWAERFALVIKHRLISIYDR